MAEVKHLSKAPIREALIDVRVKFPATFQPEQLLSLRDKLGDEFPKIEVRQLIEHQFGFKKDGEPLPSNTEKKGIQSLVFRSKDGLDVVQCRVDGYTFSRLKPYANWEYLLEQAKKCWKIYSATLKPELITRIAVRYINRLASPSPLEFSKYFTAPLPIPPRLDNSIISGFLTRVQLRIPETGVITNVIQAFEPNIENGEWVVIDIDVFKQQEYGFGDQQIWSDFEILRKIKNAIFFDSITEDAVRLFE